MRINTSIADPRVMPDVRGFYELEPTADIIKQFDPFIVPGFLQTPQAIHDSIVSTGTFTPGEGDVEFFTNIRLARQADFAERFRLGHGPQIDVVLGQESYDLSKRYPGQTQRLHDAHNATGGDLRANIRILPTGKEVWLKTNGSFTIMEGKATLPEVDRWALLANLAFGHTVTTDNEDQVRDFKAIYATLRKAAVDLNDWQK